ncbi:hypothetical protein PG994_009944 [Apiospora phragmitis]|uniref:Metallo-beta-lactamase domain-containing protein n=1 Tax=Apiospora phragmitis TaxID=2905665 RepID=A0ABR1TR28_9PEZI
MAGTTWDIPSGATVKVSIIDSTMRLSNMPTTMLFDNAVEDFDHLDRIPTWCLLVESASGRKAVFDLGAPTDFDTYAPVYNKLMNEAGLRSGFKVEKDVAQVLQDHGVAPADVSSIIWRSEGLPVSVHSSHQHLDHIGNPNTFPKSTEIVVGQGFTKAYCPGYPTNPDSPVCETYFADRTLREINFEPGPAANPKIGGFRAHDFFGDGSFYLLDTPGHTTGHLSALARTTHGDIEDTFILMGGDVCHHGGELRPSPYQSLPDPLTASHYPVPAGLNITGCPGAALFGALQTSRGRRARDEPFVDPSKQLQEDYAASGRSIREAQVPDAMDNVFFVFAHDATLLGVVDVFPKGANEWRDKGWADTARWTFLKDFAPAAAKFGEEK